MPDEATLERIHQALLNGDAPEDIEGFEEYLHGQAPHSTEPLNEQEQQQQAEADAQTSK